MYFSIPSLPASLESGVFLVENWKTYYCEMCSVEMDWFCKGGKKDIDIVELNPD